MITRVFKPFIFASLLAHGLAGAALMSDRIAPGKIMEENVVEIAFIERPLEPKITTEKKINGRRQRNKMPKLEPGQSPVKKKSAVNEPAALGRLPMARPQTIGKGSQSVQVKTPLKINSTVAPEASYFLTDPRRGKSYLGYFSRVKEKVDEVVKKKYRRRGDFDGVVALIFVLNKAGVLEEASVIEDQTRAEDVAKVFAVQCLEGASPFGPFPDELDSERISFSVTIIFNDMA